MNDSIALQTAITIWQSGEPIPLDLAAELIEEGLDVASLQEQYLDN